MTAPLFLVAAGSLPDGTTEVHLDGPEGRHAADVQRLGPGEQVLLSDGTGRYAVCSVSLSHRGALDLRVEELGEQPTAPLRLVLVQALAKGDRDLLAVETATELDVDEIVPWQADRSIVRWRAERAEKAHRKWEQTVVAAVKQSRRVRVPDVAPLAHRAELLGRVTSADLALVLHESASRALTDVTLPKAGEVLLVVGPEGGVSDDELTALTGAGAVAVRLGSTVLRTSTAGPAALAALHTRAGWR
ncbi:16S rRNA (uracil(1498)-N(3))-methyltransferase [Ornithinimicrobium tianjinense]|uniref:Ribosomal RNA small subunit methyltransferase E n=1 Tax=Ornithinimicrobium tianjinense TaxID=1195761 RepID=A0A917F5S1_9MICO|nr:16S rRNA (uracil(1498)-N(3))-methyltransferase [Ornithinimicrobium tianjinense]GGF49475.1 ribosomal RNA small subunit methyltransferase E [Ornithinimicrobium tianjinense]